MKRLLLLALFTGIITPASAAPYFQLISPSSVTTYAGALVPVSGTDSVQAVQEVALIQHAAGEGGSLLPAPWQEVWTPLAAGFGEGSGAVEVAVGPLVNLVPQAQTLALEALDDLAPNSWSNLKSLLTPVAGGSPDLTIAVGPQLVLPLEAGGVWGSPSKWTPTVEFYAGAALKF